MTNVPRPEEVINIEGKEGESLFWHAKEWLVARDEVVSRLQSEMREMWSHYGGIQDERLLALVGALCVENALDSLLESFAPGLGQHKEDKDVTVAGRGTTGVGGREGLRP